MSRGTLYLVGSDNRAASEAIERRAYLLKLDDAVNELGDWIVTADPDPGDQLDALYAVLRMAGFTIE